MFHTFLNNFSSADYLSTFVHVCFFFTISTAMVLCTDFCCLHGKNKREHWEILRDLSASLSLFYLLDAAWMCTTVYFWEHQSVFFCLSCRHVNCVNLQAAQHILQLLAEAGDKVKASKHPVWSNAGWFSDFSFSCPLLDARNIKTLFNPILH